MRIGIHTGDIVCGIVGTEIVRFDIYGANVFYANKMESSGCKGKINVSSVTKDLLMQYEFDHGSSLYEFEFNDNIYIKVLDKSVKSYFCKPKLILPVVNNNRKRVYKGLVAK